MKAELVEVLIDEDDDDHDFHLDDHLRSEFNDRDDEYIPFDDTDPADRNLLPAVPAVPAVPALPVPNSRRSRALGNHFFLGAARNVRRIGMHRIVRLFL